MAKVILTKTKKKKKKVRVTTVTKCKNCGKFAKKK